MKLIIGLGNPGSRYAKTRHNLGYMVVDELARRHNIDTTREKFSAWIGQGAVGEERILLAKPTTFMNRSGQAVQAIGRFYKLELSDLLVVTDDLALPLGKLRLRALGSAGGHNGLTDIIERLGDDGFSRLRIGIDSPQWNASDHVLGEFDAEEMSIVTPAVTRSADAVEFWIRSGVSSAMNEYNRDLADESGSAGE
ncbi:MAG: aminoacyl-tRNA hydrolase [Planctomycetes bacterium]|nr:aminoacyl-tRNA hydrolase [Planctomycetota bacterium]